MCRTGHAYAYIKAFVEQLVQIIGSNHDVESEYVLEMVLVIARTTCEGVSPPVSRIKLHQDD